ncbi:AraC family transcriptional regulator [Delftia sp. HK171]|uniref:helix-turn-helix domain-containing protein n=1 Tax=Delftia sp. HK171 TaxID=1920191 RepID=UPI0011532E8E|nr:helix-turn-helix transcriptional regulator [Delftia sp. HK171]TQL81185.1 AraC family transcriptional regulator [Delftia sp. HK171]
MSRIALTRGQFLLPFLLLLDELGAPTQSLLAKYMLPRVLESGVDDFVPIRNAIQFTDAASRIQGIPDFGHLVACGATFDYLSERLRTQVINSPTLYTALVTLCANAHLEDTNLRMYLTYHGESIRLHSVLIGVRGLQGLQYSQWLQIVLPIQVVREFVGPGWAPSTMAFEADYRPTIYAMEAWPETRFLRAQLASWIDIPMQYVSLPPIRGIRTLHTMEPEKRNASGALLDSLKLMLPSYLGSKMPSVHEIAEMANTSVRNLQRMLSETGVSYRDILNTVKFERAATLLGRSDISITEIARMLSYTDGAHFTRAFRRTAGITPMQYRKSQRTGIVEK